MKWIISLSLLCLWLILASISGCKPEATITCKDDLTTLHTQQGYVDVTGLQLGGIIFVDTSQKTLSGLGSFVWGDTDVTITPASSLNYDITNGLSITLSGVAVGDTALVKMEISGEIHFHVANASAYSFIDVHQVYERPLNADNLSLLKNPEFQGRLVGVVTYMVKGDTNLIYVGDSAIGGVAVDVPSKAINANISVAYNCAQNFTQSGSRGPTILFWNTQIYACDSIQGLVIPNPAIVPDFTTYRSGALPAFVAALLKRKK